jgi:hypothetical protein
MCLQLVPPHRACAVASHRGAPVRLSTAGDGVIHHRERCANVKKRNFGGGAKS